MFANALHRENGSRGGNEKALRVGARRCVRGRCSRGRGFGRRPGRRRGRARIAAQHARCENRGLRRRGGRIHADGLGSSTCGCRVGGNGRRTELPAQPHDGAHDRQHRERRENASERDPRSANVSCVRSDRLVRVALRLAHDEPCSREARRFAVHALAVDPGSQRQFTEASRRIEQRQNAALRDRKSVCGPGDLVVACRGAAKQRAGVHDSQFTSEIGGGCVGRRRGRWIPPFGRVSVDPTQPPVNRAIAMPIAPAGRRTCVRCAVIAEGHRRETPRDT